MSISDCSTENPAPEDFVFGAPYRVRAPGAGEPRAVVKTSNGCGVDPVEPLEAPDGRDGSCEYPMGDTRIRPRITRLAWDARLADADLEVAPGPVLDEGADADSCALLHRFARPDY